MADTCADLWVEYLNPYQQQINFWPTPYDSVLKKDPHLSVGVVSVLGTQIESAQKDFDRYTYVPNIRQFRTHGLAGAFLQDDFYNEGFAWSDSFYQLDTYFLTRPPYNQFNFLFNYGEFPNGVSLKRSVFIKILPKSTSVMCELTESDKSRVLKRYELFGEEFPR